MENSIFRKMKKEKNKLLAEQAEYEKYNNLLRQTIQQLIQSNEKLLLSLKLRFEKFTRLSNQDYAMNTSINEKIQQINQKQIEVSEISEIEKKSIEKSINLSEIELKQIKADLKYAQNSDFNIFAEISDLQKKKEKLIKDQYELKNSIKSLLKDHQNDPAFISFSHQYDQVHKNNESCMVLRNQIFKIHKEKVDQEKDSYRIKSKGHFYLEPSKLLKVLSISQTPKSTLSSADDFEISTKNVTEVEPNAVSPINSSNPSKNNENQNENQIIYNIKSKKNVDLIRHSKNDGSTSENESQNNIISKFRPKPKRKVIKYQSSSKTALDKDKKNTDNYKIENDENNYSSELQSISFSDAQIDHLHSDTPKIIKNEKIKKAENIFKPVSNQPVRKEVIDQSTPKKDAPISSSKGISISTTNANSETSSQKNLPKLSIDLNSKNGNEKHVLISPANTGRKHDNPSSVLLSPINISMTDKASTSRNSLLNMFNNSGNNGNSTCQNSPRPGGIFKPSLFHQASPMTSQTAPSTPHRAAKPSSVLQANDALEEKGKKSSEKVKNDAKNKNGEDSDEKVANRGASDDEDSKEKGGDERVKSNSKKVRNGSSNEDEAKNKNEEINEDEAKNNKSSEEKVRNGSSNEDEAKNKNEEINEDEAKNNKSSDEKVKNGSSNDDKTQNNANKNDEADEDEAKNSKNSDEKVKNCSSNEDESKNTQNSDDENDIRCEKSIDDGDGRSKLHHIFRDTISKLVHKAPVSSNDDQSDADATAFFSDRKCQTRESFIATRRILEHGLDSLDRKMASSNLELKITELEQTVLDLEAECIRINETLTSSRPGSRTFRLKNRPPLRFELNLNPLLVVDSDEPRKDVVNAMTQSDEELPDIVRLKNKIIENATNKSSAVMNQQKQELQRLLSSFQFELNFETMNSSRKKVELNRVLGRLRVVDPFLYFKKLNIEPPEEVHDELKLRRETIETIEKLERRISEIRSENEGLNDRINDLIFVTNKLQKQLTVMSKEPKFNVRSLCDNLKNDRAIINEISRQATFVGIETKHVENGIVKFNDNYGTRNINLLVESTEKMKKNLDTLKVRFNNLRAVKEKRTIVLTNENELKNLRFMQQDILNIIDVTKMRISGVISKIGKQLRSINDYNIRVPTPPPFLKIQEEEEE